MGCDIHSHAERRVNGRWEKVPDFEPFDWRNYAMFGFLAGVRSHWCDPIVEPRGFPANASYAVHKDYEDWGTDAHTPSFLTLKELLDFGYAKLAYNGETYRDNLPDIFFVDLVKLAMLGDPEDVRVVFWFDN